MKIMIDLDRVVFDCPSFIFWLGNLICTKTNICNPLTYNVIDSDKAMNYNNSLFFFRMSHSKNFKPVDNSVEILKKWNNQHFDIHFVSSRPNLKSFQKSAVEWLRKHEINYKALIFTCSNKPIYCKLHKFDIIIDDTLKNCAGAAKFGITPLWLRTKYNKNIKQFPSNVISVKNWNEIDKIVQEKNLKQIADTNNQM